MTTAPEDLLPRTLRNWPAGFALLHRPQRGGPPTLEVLVGPVAAVPTLADLPVPAGPPTPDRQELLALVPYRQVAERGFTAVDDGTPLLALSVREQATLPLADALPQLPDEAVTLANRRFDIDDESYARLVRTVVDREIGTGEGANFVLRRSFTADITDYAPASALSFFRRLLAREQGAYWTFLVHAGDRTLVGASPERHVSMRAGIAVMNPISGTYRYGPDGPTLPDLLAFLHDRKESDELYMVVDEELKMMARICEQGGRVVGPYLKEMARLAHTEYLIEGRTTRDVADILRETMFAPTVTGSPVENACRVIARYEPTGRGYYAGAVALVGRDATGGRTLDSAILIRTADIDRSGRVRIGVGATLVRHSDPRAEVAETAAKAAGLLGALEAPGTARYADHPRVRAALRRRNIGISGYWLGEPTARARPLPQLAGRRALVVDAEDTFTEMLAQQLRSLGLAVVVRRFDSPPDHGDHDLVVLGPGPGDPRCVEHPKIATLRTAVDTLLVRRRPFLAVCLSHQVLGLRLGLPVRRRMVPNQGVQRTVDLFGTPARVGFYNTFALHSASTVLDHPDVGRVEVARDPGTAEVHALRGSGFASIQFHPESLLTVDGPGLVGELLTALLPVPTG
ncbi:MAG TPA: anthranilate synthase family protein [Pilimelia sp.]|nr:anthranilate synthase family protein [Pilimelia sp.]